MSGEYLRDSSFVINVTESIRTNASVPTSTNFSDTPPEGTSGYSSGLNICNYVFICVHMIVVITYSKQYKTQFSLQVQKMMLHSFCANILFKTKFLALII